MDVELDVGGEGEGAAVFVLSEPAGAVVDVVTVSVGSELTSSDAAVTLDEPRRVASRSPVGRQANEANDSVKPNADVRRNSKAP